jgi:catechol 2,3-dioxygenase-like lactoylglutathione lyase family enzyme
MDVIRLQFAFKARDFDASIHFYETILGMTRITAWDREDGRGIVLSAGGKAAIEIYGAPKGQFYDGPAPAGTDIVFEVENVDKWYERLMVTDVSIAGPPQNKHWGGRTLFVYDPDGIPIDIFSYFGS